jgi:hypothetical protein
MSYTAELGEKWERLMHRLQDEFGKRPNMEALLFLIGLRELGSGPRTFTKEEKQDLMHIALCAVLAPSGYFELEYSDADGWPHWKEAKPLPFINIFEQTTFLRAHIIEYFEQVYEGEL